MQEACYRCCFCRTGASKCAYGPETLVFSLLCPCDQFQIETFLKSVLWNYDGQIGVDGAFYRLKTRNKLNIKVCVKQKDAPNPPSCLLSLCSQSPCCLVASGQRAARSVCGFGWTVVQLMPLNKNYFQLLSLIASYGRSRSSQKIAQKNRLLFTALSASQHL